MLQKNTEGGLNIRQFRAISGDRDFISRLGISGMFGTIHSVYSRVINIEGSDGDLYSMAAVSLDDAPNTIRIDIPDFNFLHELVIVPGSIVENVNRHLLFSSIMINVSAVIMWEAVLPAFPSVEKMSELACRLEVLKETIRLYGKSDGLKEYVIEENSGKIKDIFAHTLKVRRKNLITALRSQNFSLAYSAGRSLIGLGSGQTPSGDDFCAGLLAVFNMPDGPFYEPYQQFGCYLASEAKQLTTRISQALLKHAASGRVREFICCLLTELVDGTTESTARATKNVLNIGSMSGTDLATGIIAGLELGIEFRKVGKGVLLWQ